MKIFKNLLDFMSFFNTEEKCHQFLKSILWKQGKSCPCCGCSKIIEFKDFKKMRCKDCKAEFSIRKGTIFESSRISLQKWFMCIYLMNSNKKGISSLSLSRQVGITQKTAWFVLGRLREVSNSGFGNVFTGENQVDETYIGGKAINKHTKERIKLKEKDNKAVVLGIVNQNTKQVKSFHIQNSQYPQIAEKIIDNIEMGSTIITDEANVYKTLGKYYYKHNAVNHSKGEYVKKQSREAFIITTNAVEGMFGLLKRGIDGIYHWVSKKHLQKYLNEFNFRYNTKNFEDNQRFVAFLENVKGRLSYSELVG